MAEDAEWLDLGRQLAAMDPDEFAELVGDAEDEEDAKHLLRARFRHDEAGFASFCWPDRFDRPFNRFHDSLFAKHAATPPWQERIAARLRIRRAALAPRGYSKTTILSFLGPAHDIVYDREAYIALVSNEMRLARSLSRDLKSQFERRDDSPFIWLYGPFEVTGGVEEWEVSVDGAPSVGILARSIGTQIRGAKHPTRGIRVTKACMDDMQKPKQVNNPAIRQEWWQWMSDDLLKAGPTEGGIVADYAGTTLALDDMSLRMLHHPGWQAERWQAIESWPERQDLWDRAGLIWKDLTLGEHREAAARAFYEANREDMDRGVRVLDESTETIWDLYLQIWGEGLASVLREKQNDPVDPARQLFNMEQRGRFRVVERGGELVIQVLGDNPRTVRVAELTRWRGRWDPSMGNADGDWAAIAVVARDRYGYGYVLTCWVGKVKPSAQLEVVWSLAERWWPWGLRRWVAESNGFQELVAEALPRQREERRDSKRFHQLVIAAEPSTSNKEERIAGLEPDVANRWLLFNEDIPGEVIRQFMAFPNGDHDDGPDVIEGAWRDSGGSPVRMGQVRVR